MKRVVKIGGRAQGDPALMRHLADVALSGDALVLVHGGGDEVTALQRRLGSEPTFVGGRRVTTDADMETVRMVLSGTVNKRLVRQLVDEGIPAVGISGEDAGLLPARLLDDGALGAVGEPLGANVRAIEALLDAGLVPVISPLGRHAETGRGLNINGDDAAAAIAGALRADELLLIADVPGVLDPDGVLVPVISIDAIDDMIASGVARGGMSAKLQAARRALSAGVASVRISDINALANPGVGTRLTNAHSPA